MSKIARTRIADQAQSHLGEEAGENTCCSRGMNLWPQELGLPGIGTNSVSEAKVRAQAGHNGWEYHEDLDDVQVGDFLDWNPAVLKQSTDRHVSCLIDIDAGGNLKSIGAGGPLGKVAFQPKSGGYNPRDYFRGYFRAPLQTLRTAPTKVGPSTTAIRQQQSPAAPTAPPAQPHGAKPATYTIKRGDILLHIAADNGTTVGRLVKLNKLRNPDHIEVGQKLQLR